MRHVVGLVIVLGIVIGAMYVLPRLGRMAPARVDGGAPTTAPLLARAPDGGVRPAIRVLSITRLVPRYALRLPTADAVAERASLLRHLAARGGKVAGELPADPRKRFRVEVPSASFKPLLRDLGLGKRPLDLRSLPPRASTGKPAPTQIDVTLPEP